MNTDCNQFTMLDPSLYIHTKHSCMCKYMHRLLMQSVEYTVIYWIGITMWRSLKYTVAMAFVFFFIVFRIKLNAFRELGICGRLEVLHLLNSVHSKCIEIKRLSKNYTERFGILIFNQSEYIRTILMMNTISITAEHHVSAQRLQRKSIIVTSIWQKAYHLSP